MLFSSQPFVLLFLPLALLLYYSVAGIAAARLRALLLGSFIFYAWWDPRFVPLLAGSILANWLIARRFAASPAAWLIAAGVAVNLTLLGAFKYADFVAANLLAIFGRPHAGFDLILPLGVSFFTFQQISYLVDLKRGTAPLYPLERYATYILFFPQLIAGPIVRHNELIPQFEASPLRDGLCERLSRGGLLFILGLLKKVYFADEYAPLVERQFDAVASGAAASGGEAWFAALAYTLQLYFDFSAYSDMAIGLALMFGFTLPLNFHTPYRALDIRDFWRRWHITLSRFFRDYVYIPLGGSRQGAGGVTFAVTATMLLAGLWHGAGWTFIAWGAAHGVAILVNRGWSAAGFRLPAALAWAMTFLFVIVGWVLFRAEDFGVAASLLRSMSGVEGWGAGRVDGEDLRFLLLGMALATLGPENVEIPRLRWVARPATAVLAGVALVAVTMRVGAGRSLEFIYFQF
jgi:D-alanyl-lipoteichoic acid acyltransferase DltB (MBOAT superfamily)